MIRLKDLLNEAVYSGEPLEKGGTSMSLSTPAPAVMWLLSNSHLKGKVLDYGCGRSDRNAKYLRKQGLKVYSYDPHWGKNQNGFIGPSNKIPNIKFDVGFTSFVLNVVPVKIENQIVSKLKGLCDKSYHIVRNIDVLDMIKIALKRRDPAVVEFFTKEFGGNINKYDDATLERFAQFGTKTRNGFQRIPDPRGCVLLKETHEYKIYKAP